MEGLNLVTGTETGSGEARTRGRPRVRRRLGPGSHARCYAPQCLFTEGNEVINLLPEEVEILKLVDLDGMEQEEAAVHLGVSRKTAWRDLHSARRKVADALVNGKLLEVAGCERKREGCCPRWNLDLCPKQDGGPCPRGFYPDGTCCRESQDPEQ